jgi:hypothetical protein
MSGRTITGIRETGCPLRYAGSAAPVRLVLVTPIAVRSPWTTTSDPSAVGQRRAPTSVTSSGYASGRRDEQDCSHADPPSPRWFPEVHSPDGCAGGASNLMGGRPEPKRPCVGRGRGGPVTIVGP